jgi:hypothetical protein
VLAQGAGYHARVTSERLDGVPGGPTSFVLKGLREIPVIKGHEWGDTSGLETGDETAVEVETGLVDAPITVGDHPGPGNREPVGGDSESGK